MNIRKFCVYTADLNPQMGTEPGRVRPVVVIQTNLLNDVHPSTVICPITTNIIQKTKLLRVHLKKGEGGLKKNSDILIDQVRAIDNRRFIEHLGEINTVHKQQILTNIGLLILE
ncbi:MAG: type II toxin-antitoxin system PemK/MazF family toxin [Candidatus Marinimicrobia bacterium]|nr:type II toxin-antitoxin system PemK/MazF family toxin [Candidatus Neomarinimicrobiota bacterium]MCH7762475.1 type II toxin-antitoxin system PemK/MazF family toxin [Candidatus Neomarinimicrobiota bacterium]